MFSKELSCKPLSLQIDLFGIFLAETYKANLFKLCAFMHNVRQKRIFLCCLIVCAGNVLYFILADPILAPFVLDADPLSAVDLLN